MFNLMSKILAFVSSALLITCLVFFSLILSKTNTINTQQHTIKTLQIDNKVLEDRIEVCQFICKAEGAAREVQQAQIDSLRKSETSLLEKLGVLQGKDNNEKDSIENSTSIDVPPERTRLLNSHCERVRGSPCDNP